MKDNKYYLDLSFEKASKMKIPVFNVEKIDSKSIFTINDLGFGKGNDLISANKKLIELIEFYKNNPDENPFILERTIDNICEIIENTKNINHSPFCAYFQTLGYSYNTYMNWSKDMKIEEKRDLMKSLVELYIKNRHEMYLKMDYSEVALQISMDLASSRRRSKDGINNLVEILKNKFFVESKTINHFMNNDLCFIFPDGRSKQLFESIKTNMKIEFEFQNSQDNKYPDLLIKVKNKLFILEHKNSKGFGGSQNLELNELIRFISFEEKNPNISYISCLDNLDFYLAVNKMDKKRVSQLNNIKNNLYKNKRNYFMNKEGFENFINDLISEK